MSIPPLLLDENVSPSLVDPLWTEGIDAYHVRDRGLLGAEDHVIWARAMAEARTVVTMDLEDFVRLALREQAHPGIMILPSGGSREEQLNCVMTGISWAANGGAFTGRYVGVSFTGEIHVGECTLSLSNQRC